MQPFVAAEKVKQDYWRYIETSFPIRSETLKQQFRQLVQEQKLLWQEPFISLALPFLKGGTFDTLVEAGVLGRQVQAVQWGFDELWQHQAAAIRRLMSERPANTIVATGTGSGKTEAFLIPIVDDCLRHPEPKGVRAVIVYPMNALANDQLERLRRYLAGTGVTFGRYTGDTPFDDSDAQKKGVPRPSTAPAEERYTRREIQQAPPQILVTNYVMLELLLLRKEDQKIFHGLKPCYLVLDEVHTYTGVLGAEVACLIRRFKEHTSLQAGELTCIGTSATVGGAEEGEARQRLLQFAADLFGEHFDADAIVQEAYEDLTWPTAALDLAPDLSEADLAAVNPEDPDAVRRLAAQTLGLDLAATGDDVFAALYEAIADRRAFTELEDLLRTPKPLSAVVDEYRQLPGRQGISRAQVEREVKALLLLGSAARQPDGGEPPETRFRLKLHLVIRSLAPLSVCLNPDCGRLLTDGATECDCASSGRQAHALTLGLCRSCGADYRIAAFPVTDDMLQGPRGKRRALDKLTIEHVGVAMLQDEEAQEEQLVTLYLYPGPRHDLVGGEDEETSVQTRDYVVCPTCLHARPALQEEAVCENPTCPRHGQGPLPRFVAFLGGSRCPVCQAQGKGRRPEIITPLRSGAAASVAVLTQSLFPTLDEARNEKRLLIFADSRQDTAHQAGYLRDRYQVFTQRQIVYQSLKEYERAGKGPIPLPNLAGEIFVATRDRLQSDAEAMNLLTAVEYLSDVADGGFLEPGQPISRGQSQQAITRLQWDLTVEFTDRANSRYSLEREGLTTISYAGLDEVASDALPHFERFGIQDRDFLASLMRGLLDYMRVRQAVNYPPFRDFLDSKATPVYRREVKPTRETRMPIGFDRDKGERSRAYRVVAWYNRGAPGAHQTAIYNLVSRALPGQPPPAITGAIDRLVETLQGRGYLRHVEIGRLSRDYGRLMTKAYQIAEQTMEVTTQGDRYRCPTCGVVRGYQMRALGDGAPVCPSYRCRGKPERYVPNPADNFYVQVYAGMQPQRLYPVEHSGQLGNDERVKIETKFKAGRVNALVCTPTLELGVDIGDLVALLMRNVPPTPSNYAQRAGRAGRKRRTALILSHAGLGSHDSYFFQHPEDMITGHIKPPLFLLDNRVVVARHINSLILEKLATSVPDNWEVIRTEEGALRDEVITPFAEELVQRGEDIQRAVAEAFVRDRAAGGLAWLTGSYVQERVAEFVPGLRTGLEHWCHRYREVYTELERLTRRSVRKTKAELDQLARLSQALDTLEKDRRYYPLSYLAQVGFLPRYGFPGASVAVRDRQQREITQAAAVGIVEYAPGNVVYVGGQKLQVQRVVFRGGVNEDPTQNAQTYRYCPQCDFATDRPLDGQCPYCHEPLMTARFVDYEAAHGHDIDYITQEDEYRDRENYEPKTYLRPREGEPTLHDKTVVYGPWAFDYSRLREIDIFNRGRKERGTGRQQPFVICLECGKWHQPGRGDETSSEGSASGHLPSCTVTTWDPTVDPRVEGALHLRAHLQGDVVEIPLPVELVRQPGWVETFAQALKLGMQLEFYIAPHELDSFTRQWTEDGQPRASLVLYDTMPGGTGYLQQFVASIPQLARRVVQHLSDCPCERACYRCLKEFWNQRLHAVLDKSLVLTTLEALAAAGSGVVLPPDDVRRKFESFLESEFYALLEQKGLPLPTPQTVVRTVDGRYITRADFVYDQARLVIMTDGRAFHTHDTTAVVEDLDRRNHLTLAGWRLLEFTYRDVTETPEVVIAQMEAALQLAPATASTASLNSTGTLLPEAQAFLTQLQKLAPCCRGPAQIQLSDDNHLDALAVDVERCLAVVLVDPERWVSDSREWRQSLVLHNQTRLEGWRLIRVPRLWLATSQGRALLELLSTNRWC